MQRTTHPWRSCGDFHAFVTFVYETITPLYYPLLCFIFSGITITILRLKKKKKNPAPGGLLIFLWGEMIFKPVTIMPFKMSPGGWGKICHEQKEAAKNWKAVWLSDISLFINCKFLRAFSDLIVPPMEKSSKVSDKQNPPQFGGLEPKPHFVSFP